MNETKLFSLLIVFGTVAAILIIYRASHLMIGSKSGQDTRDLSASVIGRVSALHGLILGLVFAQLATEYRSLQGDLAQEADTLLQIVTDAELHGGSGSDFILFNVNRYIDVVINEEWQTLSAVDAASGSGREAWVKLYKSSLELDSNGDMQNRLQDNLIAQVRYLGELHSQRINIAFGADQTPFWFAAITGLVLMSVSYFAFAPSGMNVVFLTLFGLYNGITLFLIYSLSNPFAPPGALSPAALQRVSELL